MYKLIMLMFLASCGHENPDQYIEPSLKPIVDEFSREFGTVESSVVIGTPHNQSESILGECQKYQYWNGYKYIDFNRIVINSRRINEMKPWILKAVIAHEIGHCDMDLEHSEAGDGTLTDPYIYSDAEDYYKDNWGYLINDLKEKANKQ